jgi:large subunit ribosomal protein L35
MPKMKTNKLTRKKFRVSKSGVVKHARAGTSHNTGKRPSKRNRQLRGTKTLDKTARKAIQGLLPNG